MIRKIEFYILFLPSNVCIIIYIYNVYNVVQHLLQIIIDKMMCYHILLLN